jgi:hypothetical protein
MQLVLLRKLRFSQIETDMAKMQAVPATEFTRNFGRYRMLAQKGAIPVTSHGQITGYFVPPDEYEEFERFRAQWHSFATVDLTEDKIRVIADVRMDPRHDHLNALLNPE